MVLSISAKVQTQTAVLVILASSCLDSDRLNLKAVLFYILFQSIAGP